MRLGVNGRFLLARPTGVQRFGREILRALGRLTDVLLLMPRGARAPSDLAAGVPQIHGRLGGRSWEQIELPGIARRAGADVVLHPANAAPWFGGPNVVVLHDLFPVSRPDDFTLAYRCWVRLAHVGAARRAAGIVTVSEWSAGHLADILGLPPHRIGVVRQGVGPFDRPAAARTVNSVLERYGLEQPYFLVVGADPRKGTPFLEMLWQSSFQKGRPGLVLVGRPHRSVHRRRGSDRGVQGVRYLGQVPDDHLVALYTGSVALLHPASDEGFGRPPLEALACGTRVVVAPYGPAQEVLADTADIAPLEAAAWRSAIRALLTEDRTVRDERIRRGRAHATRFTWEQAAETLLEFCRAARDRAP